MPRPGPRRQQVQVRLTAALIAEIDRLAAERDVNRSEMIRGIIDAYITERLAEAVPRSRRVPSAS
jgi:metal-responsive CopG/Arc/MetJ family transcriptional regulator